MPAKARRRLLPLLALLLVTASWGVTFTVVKEAVRHVPTPHFVLARFLLALVLLFPVLRGPILERRVLHHGALVGLALGSGFLLQTWGLQFTQPSRSAFITGLSVLLVPLLAWLLGRSRPGAGPVAGCLLAAVGLAVLLRPAAGGSDPFAGDALTGGCALAFAAHLLLVERALGRGVGIGSLMKLQCLVVALLCLPFLGLEPLNPEKLLAPPFLLAVGLTGLLATAGAFLLQLYAQRHLSAVETGVVLTLEPAMATAYSVLTGTETLQTSMVTGGLLLLGAMLLAQLDLPWPGRRSAA